MFNFSFLNQKKSFLSLLGITALFLFLRTDPALAHHMIDGKLPSTFLEGFLSGIAHPVIGPDHFAFTIAIGLLATTKPWGLGLPCLFVTTAMIGTWIHLLAIDIPGLEILIGGSLVIAGIFLSRKMLPSMVSMTVFTAFAGVFHGYAYGESIVGAENAPLFAYLLGFTSIQLAISLGAFTIGRNVIMRNKPDAPWEKLRSAGLVLCGMGIAFSYGAIVAIGFP